MKIILKSRLGTHYATADYDGNKLTVLPGSKINMVLQYDAMPDVIKGLRTDTSVVSSTGEVLKNVDFTSPSAAAQFVTGRSVNGYVSWRIDDKISLKEYRKQNGL